MTDFLTTQSINNAAQNNHREANTTGLLWRVKVVLPLIWQAAMWVPGWLLLKFFCRIHIRGTEHLRSTSKNVILAANHTSHLDGVMLLAGVPPFSSRFPLYYVARAATNYERSRIWEHAIYTSSFLWLVGAVPLFEKTRDYSRALVHHVALARTRRTVTIFPEGKLSRDSSERLQPHGGVAYLAEAAQADIIPAWIEGAHRMSISSFFRRKHTVTITYGKTIPHASLFDPNDPPAERYRRAAERLMGHIRSIQSV